MVTRRYHLPAVVTAADDLPLPEQRRLSAVVLDAVARAVRGAAGSVDAVVVPADRPAAKESFVPQRVAAAGGVYDVPSYDSGGRPVGVPLRPSAPAAGPQAPDRAPSFPFRVQLDRRLNADELLREFVRQYRHTTGAEQTERLLGSENWKWVGDAPAVSPADVARGYKVLRITDHSLRIANADQRAVLDQTLAGLDAGQRDELSAEVDRRFTAATGRQGKLGTSAEDRDLAAYRLAVRDELLREQREIDELPPRIRDFLFTSGGQRPVRPADYAAVLRLAKKLSTVADADLVGYLAKVNAQTSDWREFEASVDRYLVEVARFEAAGATAESAKTALYGMERLYALYKQWRSVRGTSDLVGSVDEFGVRDPNRRELKQTEDRVDAEFRAELAAQHISSPAAFEALISGFLAAFEAKTVLIGLDLLARYDHLLFAEQQRFQAPGAADRLIAALAATPARAMYAEASDKSSSARDIRPDPELHRYLGDDYARKRQLQAEADRVKASAEKLVTAASASTLVSEEGFDRAALARATTAAEVLRVLQDYVDAHRGGIETTRANLRDDREFVYEVPPLLQVSMEQQDIRPGTVYHQIVTDKVSSLQSRKIAKAIVLLVVTIAITVATAGTGTFAVLGAAAVFGLGAWQAAEAYQEYARGHAAHQAGLLDEDPWFGWVVVAVVGAGIDLAGVASAIRPAEQALKAFKASGDVTNLSAELKVAGITERLAASIVAEAEGTVGLSAALRDFAALGGRLNMIIAGVEGVGPLVRIVYFGARQGIVSLERFVLQLRAARLIGEGELTAQQLVRLRVAFEQARTASRQLRNLGTELNLSNEKVAAVIESWSANPSRTLPEVEAQLRAVAAGASTLSRYRVCGGLPFRFDGTPAAWRALDTMPNGYAVYLVRDAGNHVIYVGITGRTGWVRWGEHLSEKGGEWLGQASRFEFTVVGLNFEREALAFEHDVMEDLQPMFNKQWTYLERFGTAPEPADVPKPNASFVLDIVHL